MNISTWNRNQPWALTVLRIVTGIIFLAHGWQKISVFGVAGFTGFLTQLGVPAASLAAVIVIAVELIGGLALILGIGTRFVAIPLAINMLVALVTVHLSAGFFVSDNGYEFVLLLLGASIALAIGGSGAFALDNMIGKRVDASRTVAA